MENTVLDDHFKSGSSEIGLTTESISYLAEAGKWGRFLAIMGFIMCGIIVLIGLFASSIFSMMSNMTGSPSAMAGLGGMVTVIYLLIALFYFYPCLTLYRFSTNAIEAARSRSTENVTMALKNLKANFKFVGIVTIVILSIYVLAIIFGIFVASSMR